MAEETGISILEKVLDEHLVKVKEKILNKAKEIASQDQEDLSVTHLATAINEYAPGNPSIAANVIKDRRRFFDYVPPVTVLSAILAFAFAGLGLWALLGKPEVRELGSQGFLDIAKIFAGAIVGSASAVVASSTRQTKG